MRFPPAACASTRVMAAASARSARFVILMLLSAATTSKGRFALPFHRLRLVGRRRGPPPVRRAARYGARPQRNICGVSARHSAARSTVRSQQAAPSALLSVSVTGAASNAPMRMRGARGEQAIEVRGA